MPSAAEAARRRRRHSCLGNGSAGGRGLATLSILEQLRAELPATVSASGSRGRSHALLPRVIPRLPSKFLLGVWLPLEEPVKTGIFNNYSYTNPGRREQSAAENSSVLCVTVTCLLSAAAVKTRDH
jgi:hypothetical protein